MKTIEIKLYSFDELSDEAKQKAIEKLSDINVDYDWGDCTYEDAANIGLKITSFDLERGSYVNGVFTIPAVEVAAKIVQEHGETCETHKTALQFGIDYAKLKEKYKITDEDDWEEICEIEALEEAFLSDLCEHYLKILRDEYEYVTSAEAIIETIKANEYDFLESGKLY